MVGDYYLDLNEGDRIDISCLGVSSTVTDFFNLAKVEFLRDDFIGLGLDLMDYKSSFGTERLRSEILVEWS